jgi:hypothetical protein
VTPNSVVVGYQRFKSPCSPYVQDDYKIMGGREVNFILDPIWFWSTMLVTLIVSPFCAIP